MSTQLLQIIVFVVQITSLDCNCSIQKQFATSLLNGLFHSYCRVFFCQTFIVSCLCNSCFNTIYRHYISSNLIFLLSVGLIMQSNQHRWDIFQGCSQQTWKRFCQPNSYQWRSFYKSGRKWQSNGNTPMLYITLIMNEGVLYL